MDARKELRDSLEDVKKENSDLKQNLIPIEFIYVQLPNEKSPTEIWSGMTWNDVSSTYAGVLFRVVGGNAKSFGQVQAETYPMIKRARNIEYGMRPTMVVQKTVIFSLNLIHGVMLFILVVIVDIMIIAYSFI